MGLPASNAGAMGSIPGWGTKIPHAATKTPCTCENVWVSFFFFAVVQSRDSDFTLGPHFFLIPGMQEEKGTTEDEMVGWHH